MSQSGPAKIDPRRGAPPAIVHALLVEDDDVDAKLIGIHAATLRDPGLSLTRVVSAEAGRQAIRNRRFDLCILDFWLGCESSLRLLSDLDAAPHAPPTVVLTSLSTPEIGALCRQAGARAFIGKERLDAASLHRLVVEALDPRPLQDRAPDEVGPSRDGSGARREDVGTGHLDDLCTLLEAPVGKGLSPVRSMEAFRRRARALDRLSALGNLSETARFAEFERLVSLRPRLDEPAISFATAGAVVAHACEVAGAALAGRGQTMVWRGEATARVAVADAVPLLFLVHEFVCRVGARSASDSPIAATSTQADGTLSLRLVARSEKACEAVAGRPLFDSLLAELGGSVAIEAPVSPDGALTASLHLAHGEPARPAARAPHAAGAATFIQT